MRVRRKYIQNLVNEILSSNNIESAPVDLKRITKALGIQVVKQAADDKIAGFLIKDFNNKNALIGVNEKHHPNRQRFTIAHEIGHYFLHNYQGVHFDGKNTGLQVYLRDDNSATGLNVEEREANLFAAKLLMPEKLLEKDILTISEIYLLDEEDLTIKRLAAKYKVSVRALTYRLSNLEYIKL